MHDFLLNHYGEITECSTIVKFHVAHTVVIVILRLTETANPLIYSMCTKELQEGIKNLFGMKVAKKDGALTNHPWMCRKKKRIKSCM